MPVESLQVSTGLRGWLSRPWWAGVGVILAAALALLGYFMASGSSASIHGSCNALGNNNTVNCPSSGSEAHG